jgi:hypothetical protein
MFYCDSFIVNGFDIKGENYGRVVFSHKDGFGRNVYEFIPDRDGSQIRIIPYYFKAIKDATILDRGRLGYDGIPVFLVALKKNSVYRGPLGLCETIFFDRKHLFSYSLD